MFWNNEYAMSLVKENRHTLLPLIFPTIHEYSKKHWNKYEPSRFIHFFLFRSIHGLMYNAVKVMMEMDQRLYSECNEIWIKKGENWETRPTEQHNALFRGLNKQAKKNPMVCDFFFR